MKRSMGGGAHRGPPAHTRQRRTLRLMQIILALAAVGLFVFAGYSWGRATGWDEARSTDSIEGAEPPGAVQIVVLFALGGGALAGAWLLGGPGVVTLPTPARLEELTGRAERAAAEREQGSA